MCRQHYHLYESRESDVLCCFVLFVPLRFYMYIMQNHHTLLCYASIVSNISQKSNNLYVPNRRLIGISSISITYEIGSTPNTFLTFFCQIEIGVLPCWCLGSNGRIP